MTTQVLFLHRPPSAQWEPLVPDQRSGMQLWVWFRPAHLPTGLVVSVPDQVVNACPDGLPFTLADILNAAGVPFQLLGGVSIFGAEWQPPAALLPLLNHALPSTSRNGRFEICVQTMVPGMYPSPMPEAYPAGLDAAAWADAVGEDGITDFPEDDIASGQPLTEGMMFERIESAWKVCLQVERQLQGVRQKLSAMIAALGKLDRA
ncbi:MAG: hypothetical protein KDA89_14650, partial [Planctomycetaceae bacterium]|nr:hypothetical protein [Planctomycetaceae bacterium]